MSGKSRLDYRCVVNAICIVGAVVDFDCALWQAVEVFPNAKIQGCVFHWSQAILQKVLGLGLSTAYNEDDATHKYVKRLMALPFLPHEHVNQVSTSKAHGSIPHFGLQRNGVFKRSIWTNNNIKGCHYCLNNQARCGKSTAVSVN